mgnify:FL=1
MGWVLLVFGLLVGHASAADMEPEAHSSVPTVERRTAGPFGGGRGPAETVSDEIEEKKSKEQLEREARLAQIEEANRAKIARVVVLQWKGTDTTFRNENLQRNVKARINRPDARFYPDIDLYQAGRAEPDPTVRPIDQRAIVPDSAIDMLIDAADEVGSIPWNALSEQDWGSRAQELLRMSDEVWFIDRPELREPMFLLYAQIGRAAENANQGSPPYYESVGGRTVNYFWYLAAALAHRDPSLMSKITDADLNTSITFLKDQIDSGSFAPATVAFDDRDQNFDPKTFAAEYELFIDGLTTTVTDPDGLLEVPRGRSDIYLRRPGDGHSLSDRYEQDKADNKFHFVLQNAQKRMGLDFQDQLMENPYECIPAIDGDILTYLSIYQKLHPKADVYIVVPYAGSTAPGRLFLWRWDKEQAHLVRVQDNTGGFPIRFAAMMNAGVAFGTVDYTAPADDDLQNNVDSQEPGEAPDIAGGIDQFADIAPIVDGIPVEWQLRMHYNRLMFGFGLQYKIGLGTAEDPSFADAYQTDEKQRPASGGEGGHYAVKNADVACEPGDAAAQVPGCFDPDTGAEIVNGTKTVQVLALRERRIQRQVYGILGVMLGRDAASGWGPRGYIRYGWTNAPHAVLLDAHAGYTARVGKDNKDENRTGRVRALLDIDFFGGVLLPFRNSIYMRSWADIERSGEAHFLRVGKPFATFGFTAGAGITF